MGEVYTAPDARLDRLVAINVLPADKLTDPERKRRFIQEARAASALNHPEIVTIYDVDPRMASSSWRWNWSRAGRSTS
jgi:serine/threonine protein kinase